LDLGENTLKNAFLHQKRDFPQFLPFNS
jgi:hypothetical protein